MWSAAAGVLAACDAKTAPPQAKVDGVLALALHKEGLGVLDTATGAWKVPPAPAAVGPELTRLAAVQGEQLAIWSLPVMRQAAASTLPGTWTPRAVSGSDQVALVEGPSGEGIYRPASRVMTKIRIAGSGKDFSLPGNFEPEAFSPDGGRLYLLDYIPPRQPELYRVRVLDLATGAVHPLNTKDKQPVPPGSEETMRGSGRKAVYDPVNGVLFTLYTHQQGHQHTGELLGVRPGSPDVHAFIHALHLDFGWAVCIDLPKPFGESAPEGHTLALAPDSSLLYAVSAAHGTVARINPESLNVLSVKTFAPLTGEASAAATAGGRIYVAAGNTLSDTASAFDAGGPLHGLAATRGGQLWSVRAGRAVSLDFAAKRVLDGAEVAGLQAIHAIVGQ